MTLLAMYVLAFTTDKLHNKLYVSSNIVAPRRWLRFVAETRSSINKRGNVRITQRWGAFANHCCHEKTNMGVAYWSVCACAYVHVALLIQHATPLPHIVTSFVAPRSPLHFSALSHKRCDFRKKVIEREMCFNFLCNFCLKHFPF
jgi:hypothetical protein